MDLSSDKLNLILIFLTLGPIVFYCKITQVEIQTNSMYITLTNQFNALSFKRES